ncbi:MAG: RNA polymerase sigma factor (sigma-70 family) [Candidatus Paceibacteria bacterium]
MEGREGIDGKRTIPHDSEAVRHFLTRYEPRLLAYVSKRIHPSVRRWVEPQDIVQQVIHENLTADDLMQLGEEQTLQRLYRTAKLRLIDELRRHATKVGESFLPQGYVASSPQDTDGLVTLADSKEWLKELIKRLPLEYAETIELVSLEGLSFVEAAKRLNVLPDTVRKRFNKAREVLSKLASEAASGE